jgi:hypothetical protein
MNLPTQQAAGYLVVDSFTLIEASFWEYDPERFKIINLEEVDL